ncbi:MAG: hypothetical protein ACLPY5_03580 [Candidatus Bathyarchaeia archaeon]
MGAEEMRARANAMCQTIDAAMRGIPIEEQAAARCRNKEFLEPLTNQ